MSISDSDTQGKDRLGVRMHMLSDQEAASPPLLEQREPGVGRR